MLRSGAPAEGLGSHQQWLEPCPCTQRRAETDAQGANGHAVLLAVGAPHGSPGNQGVPSRQGVGGRIRTGPLGGDSGSADQGSGPRGLREFQKQPLLPPLPLVTVLCPPRGREDRRTPLKQQRRLVSVGRLGDGPHPRRESQGTRLRWGSQVPEGGGVTRDSSENGEEGADQGSAASRLPWGVTPSLSRSRCVSTPPLGRLPPPAHCLPFRADRGAGGPVTGPSPC